MSNEVRVNEENNHPDTPPQSPPRGGEAGSPPWKGGVRGGWADHWSFAIGLSAILLASLLWRVRGLEGFGWDYDEGVYMMTARLVYDGYRLFSEVWSWSPPLFIESLVAAFRLWGPTAGAARLAIVGYGLVGIAAAALVGRQMGGRLAGLVAAGLLSITPLYFHYSRACLADVPAVSLAMLALAWGLGYYRSGKWGWLALAGITMGLSLLMKMLAPFVGIVLGLLVLVRAWRAQDEPPTVRWRCLVLSLTLLGTCTLLPVVVDLLPYDAAAVYAQVIRPNVEARAAYPLDLLGNVRKTLEYLPPNAGLVALGAYGAWLLGRRRFGQTWPLLAWFGLGLATILWQTPVRDHFLTALLLPLVVWAGVVVDSVVAYGVSLIAYGLWLIANRSSRAAICDTQYAISDTRYAIRDKRYAISDTRYAIRDTHHAPRTARHAILGGVLLVAYLVTLPGLMRANAEKQMAPQGGRERAAVDFLRQVTAPGDMIVSDDQMLVFQAGRTVPPPLADTSIVRIRIGHLPVERLAALTSEYGAEAVVSWSGRFAILLPGYLDWAREHYLVRRVFDEQRQIFVGRRVASAAEIPHRQWAGVGEDLEFLGYDLDAGTRNTQHGIRLTLYWRAERPVAEDYTVFVHLRGEEGRLLAQQDGQPLHGLLPTSAWPPGEIIPDRHFLAWPDGTPPDGYRLVVGMYRLATLERLPVTDEAGRVMGDSITINRPQRSGDL